MPVLEPARQRAYTEYEENVSENRPSQRCFDHLGQPRAQALKRDDHLGCVAKRRIQEPADSPAQPWRKAIGSLPQPAGASLAQRLGAGIGGLLNATFGNAAEMIIAFQGL